ncbi:MAG: hypothetical protein ACJ72M_04745 [Propionibacteriaceae bacterium]|jgi:hypothetical protein
MIGVDRGGSQGEQQMGFAGAGRTDHAQVLRGPNLFQGGEIVEAGHGTEEAVRSNSSNVLVTGNIAWRGRVRALEASRAAISASTRVRSNSSGLQRWV